MTTATHMKMINGRVDKHAAGKAAAVLKRQGLTVSAFIRNSVEHIARTGEVPECGFSEKGETVGREALRDFVKSIKAKPMPGKREFAGIGEDELVDALRLERYGY